MRPYQELCAAAVEKVALSQALQIQVPQHAAPQRRGHTVQHLKGNKTANCIFLSAGYIARQK